MHGHQNRYTVDKDPGRYPDLIADLQDPEVLTYLSEILHDCLKIVYVEGWSFHSVKFHEMAYKTLKKGGILLYSLGQNKTPGHIMELKDTLMKAGFDLNKLYFFHNPFTEISKYGLRRALMQYPTVNTIEEINNKDLLSTLCKISSIDEYEKRNVFVYKVEYMTGVLPKFLDILKKLSHIDPFLGWGLSYEYYRHDYFVIEK
jgi:hypothetical protein